MQCQVDDPACPSPLALAQRADAEEMVKAMGGEFSKAFTDDVTHLISDSIDSEKVFFPRSPFEVCLV